MNDTILTRIIKTKRRRVEQLKSGQELNAFYERARAAAAERPPNRMRDALSAATGTNIIAEFKRASPSKGTINREVGPSEAALAYQRGGAVAISVLTEEDFFGGSLDDLQEVGRAVDLPILRKDFVVDEFQIYESAIVGADAVLLIVAALGIDQLRTFLKLATGLKLAAVVEVHDSSEMAMAADVGAQIIGVNNRDLKSFAVSLDVSRSLIKQKPEGITMIAESGFSTAEEVSELRGLGYSAFLIGETLMRSGDPAKALRGLMCGSAGSESGLAPVAAEGLS